MCAILKVHVQIGCKGLGAWTQNILVHGNNVINEGQGLSQVGKTSLPHNERPEIHFKYNKPLVSNINKD